MPSFVCDFCQETLKKAKLDDHKNRCHRATFSCINCCKTFKGIEYRQHISCIDEVEKYQKISPSIKKEKNIQLKSENSNVNNSEIKEIPSKRSREENIPNIMTDMDHIISLVQQGGSLGNIKNNLKKKLNITSKKASSLLKNHLFFEKLFPSTKDNQDKEGKEGKEGKEIIIVKVINDKESN